MQSRCWGEGIGYEAELGFGPGPKGWVGWLVGPREGTAGRAKGGGGPDQRGADVEAYYGGSPATFLVAPQFELRVPGGPTSNGQLKGKKDKRKKKQKEIGGKR